MILAIRLTNQKRIALLRRLIELSNALSRNTSFNLNTNLSDLLDVDIDVDVDVDISTDGDVSNPNSPSSLRALLESLLNEQIQVTTPFDTISGTLIAVKSNYIVIVEGSGNLVFVVIENIESVVEL